MTWGSAPPSLPPGAQATVLLGSPAKEGPFVLRLKFRPDSSCLRTGIRKTNSSPYLRAFFDRRRRDC